LSKTKRFLLNIAFRLAAIMAAFLFTVIIIAAIQAQPVEAYKNIIMGSLGSSQKFGEVIRAWLPLVIVTTGLMATYTAGLWNIGVEGQITLGAIFTTAVLRLLQDQPVPASLALVLAILAGALGGVLWASLAAILKIYGGINEIFAGLGLNFVADAFTLWLIFGPWKRPGVGSMSGTIPFKDNLRLPTLPGSPVSIYPLLIAAALVIGMYILLRNSYFGLRLKAIGKNMRAAFLKGIPTARYMLGAFMLCGFCAGLAGAIQVTGVHFRLVPSIASGYGFLGILVAMLVNFHVLWALPVAFIFSTLNTGSIQLPMVMKLDASLAGVLQGSLVLFMLLLEGVRKKIMTHLGEG
jgi:general nucleoside transport system permease protein